MSPPNNHNEHPYCDKVIDHDRELGGVQAYLKTVIDGQKKLFERTDELCELQVASTTAANEFRKSLGDSKDHIREIISDELKKSLSCVVNGALDSRRGTEERTSKSIHDRDEAGIEPIAKGPLSGFLDRSWNKFLENIGPILITLFLWWIVWAISKSKFFGELPIVKLFGG
jgi:hypothetical protein